MLTNPLIIILLSCIIGLSIMLIKAQRDLEDAELALAFIQAWEERSK